VEERLQVKEIAGGSSAGTGWIGTSSVVPGKEGGWLHELVYLLRGMSCFAARQSRCFLGYFRGPLILLQAVYMRPILSWSCDTEVF